MGNIPHVVWPQTQGGGRGSAGVGNANAPSKNVHCTVLLIEDDALVRRVTEAMLKKLGCAVLVAEDGMEGVDLFQEHKDRIDLVLSDLDLPRLSGWGVLTAIRDVHPGIPVILASGYNEIVGRSASDTGQPPPILHKPYSLTSLRRSLEAAFTERII